MALSTQDGFIIISFSDILFCEAMGNYCRIQLRDQKMHVVSKPLKALTAVLPARDFIRTHQSYLVRFDDIVSIGSAVILSSGKSIPIARSRRQPLGVFLKNKMPTI
jgi:two-component system LytT family response regulator